MPMQKPNELLVVKNKIQLILLKITTIHNLFCACPKYFVQI